MSVFSDNSPSGDASTAWRRHLAALPSVDPPEMLWRRLQAATAAAAPRRSNGPWLAATAAVAASALLAAVLAWPRLHPTSTEPDMATVPALQVAQPDLTARDTGLRQLDDELALAYAHDMDEAQIAALWEARARLIESLQGPTPALLARM